MSTQRKTFGIVTSRARDYGAELRAFALATSIGFLPNCDAELIRFDAATKGATKLRRAFAELCSNGVSLDFWKNRAFRAKVERKRIDDYFVPFEKEFIPESEAEYSDEDALTADASTRYERCVVGAERIWNPLSYSDDSTPLPFRFLRFVDESKRAAYAPSFGAAEIPAKYRDKIAEYVARIPLLSCRDRTDVRLIKELTGRDAKLVVDPTFLLEREDWLALVDDLGDFSPIEAGAPRPYVLAYFRRNDRRARERTAEIARRTGCAVVVLPFCALDAAFEPELFRPNCDVGPREFVKTIAGARLVCSDSFCATALSINLNKPFFFFRSSSKRADAETGASTADLLAKLGLANREATPDASLAELESRGFDVDFAPVESILTPWRDESRRFLEEICRVDSNASNDSNEDERDADSDSSVDSNADFDADAEVGAEVDSEGSSE